MSDREIMMRELQRVVQPCLRAAGFAGTFPHYRRFNAPAIDLLTFQFDRHGGGFVVEIARCDAAGLTTHWGKKIPPEKVTAWDLHPSFRRRIVPNSGEVGTSGWFRFDARTVEKAAADAKVILERREIWEGVVVGTAIAPR